MKLLLFLIFVLVISTHGGAPGESKNVVNDEPSETDKFENDVESNEEGLEEIVDRGTQDEFEALADPDELETLEESEDMTENDPIIAQSITYYCRFCKVCKAYRRLRRCTGRFMRKACKYCKYCNLKTYWNLVKRIRIRIRLRRIRVRRIFGRRRRRRRRSGGRRRRRRSGRRRRRRRRRRG